MRRFLIFTLMPILATMCSPSGAQEGGESLSFSYPQGPAAVPLLREIWDIGADSIYPSHLGQRFDSETLEKLEDLLRTEDDAALADVLNPFLESLGVSHTRFYDRRHQSYYLLRSLFSTRDLDSPQLYTIGVQLDDLNPGLVRAVLEGSPAAEAGFLREDLILTVDGVPFHSLLQWQRPASTRIGFLRKGEELEVTLTPVFQSFHRALALATSASRRVMTCDDRRIGYLHLWSGTHDVFLDTLKDSIADARERELDGFILDLRDGYGGAWWPYLDPFYPDRSTYFTYATTDAKGTTDPVSADAQSNNDAWTGPLAVITNSGTRSGKESLAFQFSRSDRATVFGTTTAGAFTAGRGVFADREADYILYLSVLEMTLDGVAIEGAGVVPDVAVAHGVGGDAPLAAALEYLEC